SNTRLPVATPRIAARINGPNATARTPLPGTSCLQPMNVPQYDAPSEPGAAVAVPPSPPQMPASALSTPKTKPPPGMTTVMNQITASSKRLQRYGQASDCI